MAFQAAKNALELSLELCKTEPQQGSYSFSYTNDAYLGDANVAISTPTATNNNTSELDKARRQIHRLQSQIVSLNENIHTLRQILACQNKSLLNIEKEIMVLRNYTPSIN